MVSDKKSTFYLTEESLHMLNHFSLSAVKILFALVFGHFESDVPMFGYF